MTSRAIRIPEVCNLTGMSRATIWRKARDGSFPQPFRISEAITSWDESEIVAWLDAKKANVIYLRERRIA